MWFNRSITKIKTTLQLLDITSCRHVQHAKNLDEAYISKAITYIREKKNVMLSRVYQNYGSGPK